MSRSFVRSHNRAGYDEKSETQQWANTRARHEGAPASGVVAIDACLCRNQPGNAGTHRVVLQRCGAKQGHERSKTNP